LDKIWGIGFGEKNAEANKEKWGQNLLGIALMNVRMRIRAGKKEGDGVEKEDGEKKDDA
jgi:hypothetical protein